MTNTLRVIAGTILLCFSFVQVQAVSIQATNEQSEPSENQTQEHRVKSFKLTIPIHWQLTQARIQSTGSTNLTESFREEWTLEVRKEYTYLISPRARVEVFVPNTKTQTPKRLYLLERDFARLLGIAYRLYRPALLAGGADGDGIGSRNETSQKKATANVGNGLISIQLSPNRSTGEDFQLQFAEGQHCSVHLEIGSLNQL